MKLVKHSSEFIWSKEEQVTLPYILQQVTTITFSWKTSPTLDSISFKMATLQRIIMQSYGTRKLFYWHSDPALCIPKNIYTEFGENRRWWEWEAAILVLQEECQCSRMYTQNRHYAQNSTLYRFHWIKCTLDVDNVGFGCGDGFGMQPLSSCAWSSSTCSQGRAPLGTWMKMDGMLDGWGVWAAYDGRSRYCSAVKGSSCGWCVAHWSLIT